MRLQQYAQAQPDLDQAIQLRPDYPHALMNRADIHNYYYSIIALGVAKQGSLCGHRLLALNNGWSFGVFWQLLTRSISAVCD